MPLQTGRVDSVFLWNQSSKHVESTRYLYYAMLKYLLLWKYHAFDVQLVFNSCLNFYWKQICISLALPETRIFQWNNIPASQLGLLAFSHHTICSTWEADSFSFSALCVNENDATFIMDTYHNYITTAAFPISLLDANGDQHNTQRLFAICSDNNFPAIWSCYLAFIGLHFFLC